MGRRVYFKDGSSLEIAIEVLEAGTMATLAYRKVMDFVEYELMDEEETDDEILDNFDEDELELSDDDLDELEEEDLTLEEEDLDELDPSWEEEDLDDDSDDDWRDARRH